MFSLKELQKDSISPNKVKPFVKNSPYDLFIYNSIKASINIFEGYSYRVFLIYSDIFELGKKVMKNYTCAKME